VCVCVCVCVCEAAGAGPVYGVTCSVVICIVSRRRICMAVIDSDVTRMPRGERE